MNFWLHRWINSEGRYHSDYPGFISITTGSSSPISIETQTAHAMDRVRDFMVPSIVQELLDDGWELTIDIIEFHPTLFVAQL